MFPCVQSDGTSYIFLSSSFFWQSSQTLVTMKTISLAALSLLLLASSQLDRTEAVSLRQAEETVELPEDFDCKLCSKCGWVVVNTSPSTELLIFRQSCTLQCNLCSGCDLLKAFDVSRELYPSAVESLTLTSRNFQKSPPDFRPSEWSCPSAIPSAVVEWRAAGRCVSRARRIVTTVNTVRIDFQYQLS